MLSQLPSIKEAKPARGAPDERSKERGPLGVVKAGEEKDFTPRYDVSGDEDSA